MYYMKVWTNYPTDLNWNVIVVTQNLFKKTLIAILLARYCWSWIIWLCEKDFFDYKYSSEHLPKHSSLILFLLFDFSAEMSVPPHFHITCNDTSFACRIKCRPWIYDFQLYFTLEIWSGQIWSVVFVVCRINYCTRCYTELAGGSQHYYIIENSTKVHMFKY